MKKILLICFIWMGYLGQAQESRLAVQAGHSDYMTKAVIDSDRDLLISYGSFSDKTLKFWDRTTGILLKTVDIPEHVRDFTLDEKNGRTFLGTKNEIIIYDNNTLKELKRIPSKAEIQNVVFRHADNLLYFLTGDFDDIELNTFDSNSSKMQKVGGAKFPNPQAGEMKFIANEEYIWIKSSTRPNQIYDMAQKTYGQFDMQPAAFFENGDQIYTTVMDETHLKVTKYSVAKREYVWEKMLVVKKNTNRSLSKFKGTVEISEENNSLWVSYLTTPLIELHADTGEVKGVIYNDYYKSKIIYDKDYMYVLEAEAMFTQGALRKYQRYSSKPVAYFGYDILNSQNIVFGKEEKSVQLISSDLNGKIYSLFANNATTQMVKYNPKFSSESSYSLYGDLFLNSERNKGYYMTRNDKEGIKEFVPGDKNSFRNLTTDFNKNTNTASFNADSKLLATVVKNRLKIINVENEQTVFDEAIQNIRKAEQAYISISDNGEGIAVGLSDEIIFDAKYEDRLDYYDITAKKLLWSTPNSYRELYHLKNGKELLAINNDSKQANIFNTENGTVIRSFKIPKANYTAQYAVSPKGTKLLYFDKDIGVKIYNIITGTLEFESLNFKEMYNASFAFVTEDIYAQNSDGATRFFKTNSDKEFLRLVLFLDSEWIAHTPEGLFDGSQNAWDRVAFVRGRETIPLNQVFDKFYVPRLLFNLLNGGTVEKPNIDIDKIKNPPSVTMSYTEGTRNLTVEDASEVIITENSSAKITVEGRANGDSILEVRLFHNGKLVSNNTRNLSVEDDVSPEGKQIFNLTLLEGENFFSAVAINSQNTESTPDSMTIEYTPKKEEVVKPAGIQLHLMVVGIDTYKNPKYNLNYAVADANSFKEAIDKGMKGITSKVNTYFIENNNAVRDNILNAFKTISTNSNPQDIFVFYYAGHGMMDDSAERLFYLVPHDVTQIYGSGDGIKSKGISANELKTLSANIGAQKQLYILDACQSGGALSAVVSRGAAEEKAIAQLARSTGTHWLTASGSEQFATEFDQLGHGVFTYVLLEALSGKADSGDGRITVNELKAYLESQVPEVSAKYKGSPQYPSSFGFGQDFPVGIKN